MDHLKETKQWVLHKLLLVLVCSKVWVLSSGFGECSFNKLDSSFSRQRNP